MATGPLHLVLTFDAEAALSRWRNANPGIAALWAGVVLRAETQRMERRVRDLYDRFL